MSAGCALAPLAGERVVVAMSGGVDSSLAAALAVECGCDAVAVTLRLSGESSRCCSLADAEDARRTPDRPALLDVFDERGQSRLLHLS